MIKSVRIKNFKALRDTGLLTLPDFGVFIGNNGSGKSSVIEALYVLQRTINYGIQRGFNGLGRLEDVRHYDAKYSEAVVTTRGFRKVYEPVGFEINAQIGGSDYSYILNINTIESGDLYVIESEELIKGGKKVFWRSVLENEGLSVFSYVEGSTKIQVEGKIHPSQVAFSLLSFPSEQSETAIREFNSFIQNWQFLNMNAHLIGQPVLQDKTTNIIRLKSDGSNLADFVRYRSAIDEDFLPGLISKMQFVLPYVETIRSNYTTGRKEEVILEMLEQGQKNGPIPGWLFSSGTLRNLALLAVFNQPELPTAVFIDEIENGLDPRTIGMLLEEIENAVESNCQVLCTSHSPYLLDLVKLENVLMTERKEQWTEFYKPGDDESLNLWKERFAPGDLYISGRLKNPNK